jgi:hypothetical protein
MIGWGAILVASAGIYCIYKNKEMYGKSHVRIAVMVLFSRPKNTTHPCSSHMFNSTILFVRLQLMTPHAWCGAGVMASSVGLGLAGGTWTKSARLSL